jgi:TonB family protein
MKSTPRAISVIVLATLLSVTAVASFGQDARPIKNKVTPVYPELAKKLNVGGTVRVQLVVAPSGQVKSAKAVGGHPLLIEAAVSAAKQFKYAPAAEESTEIVPFNFNRAQ